MSRKDSINEKTKLDLSEHRGGQRKKRAITYAFVREGLQTSKGRK